MAAAWNLCGTFGLVAITNEPLELWMRNLVWDKSYTYLQILYKYFFEVNNYKHGGGTNILYYVRQIQAKVLPKEEIYK